MSFCQLTTPRAQQWLANSRQGWILHLFTAVCNLVNEKGEVLSLVSGRIGAGPFALVLSDQTAWPADASAAVRVDHEARRLSVGRLVVDYGSAPCWQPRPAWHRLCNCLTLMTAHPPAASHNVVALSPEIAALLQQLLEGICGENSTLVYEAALGLAGRGQGLTPTGDDLLLGVLYALWIWRPDDRWFSLIADTAAPRTTTLSAAFLRAAAAGEASAPWHRLAAGDMDAVAAILTTGHHSGAETWTAFVTAGARLNRESG